MERRRFIDTDVPDSEEAAYYGSVDNDGVALDEEDESGLGDAGVITGVTQSGTEEVEEVQWVMKYSFLFVLYVETYFLTHTGL